MTLAEITIMLESLNIPIAYSHFEKEDAPGAPPYCVFYTDKEDIRGADNLNLLKEMSIIIELYTAKKDVLLENQLENLFNDVELLKIETYIDDEKMYQIAYAFDTIIKL